MNINAGIAGEFRVVVTKADGSIKEDTGYQKNLILNQGLDFFGDGNGTEFNVSCVIGSGNNAPAVNQTLLDSVVAIAKGVDKTDNYAYADEGDSLYKIWEQRKYRFEGLNNVNISEVGLVSNGDTTSEYYLTTRALIKDSGGTPTTITVKSGETLDIYYKIHKVIDTSDKEFVVNMLDGDGGSEPYNVVVRPTLVNNYRYADFKVFGDALQGGNAHEFYFSIFTQDIGSIYSLPSSSNRLFYVVDAIKLVSYVRGSYKRGFYYSLSLDLANGNIRSLYVPTSMGLYQMRFGSVADDSPIPKTNKHTLTIPLEVSWGRYEGEL